MGRGHSDKQHYRSRRKRSASRSSSESRYKHRPTRSKRNTNISCQRKRRRGATTTAWDIPAPGYEHLTPVQYKTMQASGQIASRIVSETLPTGESASIATVTRQARRLYVGNIPFTSSDMDMIEFFNGHLRRLNGTQLPDGNAVLSCQINLEKNFAFLEFRSMDEATVAMSFDGVMYRGQILKIRRPHDYHPVPTLTSVDQTESQSQLQALDLPISTVVPDSPHKIYIGGLPVCLDEEQVKELLVTFGSLRGFNLVREPSTGQSKGYAFCEYIDNNITDHAIAGLHGMQLGERKLVVQRSLAGVRNLVATQVPVLQVPGFPTDMATETATEVLCLLNMVLPEELTDDAEYQDIRTDIKVECAKFGKVKSLKIPRPAGNTLPNGCGKVFVRFETVEDCTKALNALSGRKFSGRIVMTSFYDPGKYKRREFQ